MFECIPLLEMLQKLLFERLGMKIHSQKGEVIAYNLRVSQKGIKGMKRVAQTVEQKRRLSRPRIPSPMGDYASR